MKFGKLLERARLATFISLWRKRRSTSEESKGAGCITKCLQAVECSLQLSCPAQPSTTAPYEYTSAAQAHNRLGPFHPIVHSVTTSLHLLPCCMCDSGMSSSVLRWLARASGSGRPPVKRLT